ncbi:hypothetical protein [Haloarcula amylovorans]|uniref:hypothetical protein n=1 Tax=Haloarcula amylovorans TaxID=2562280 RepID=UPI00107617B3|nr:hypothetical protein [Halomicroarcula amylolytica]
MSQYDTSRLEWSAKSEWTDEEPSNIEFSTLKAAHDGAKLREILNNARALSPDSDCVNDHTGTLMDLSSPLLSELLGRSRIQRTIQATDSIDVHCQFSGISFTQGEGYLDFEIQAAAVTYEIESLTVNAHLYEKPDDCECNGLPEAFPCAECYIKRGVDFEEE